MPVRVYAPVVSRLKVGDPVNVGMGRSVYLVTRIDREHQKVHLTLICGHHGKYDVESKFGDFDDVYLRLSASELGHHKKHRGYSVLTLASLKSTKHD